MKRVIVSWLWLVVAFGGLNAFACTGFYVGKKVSADGTTMIGRTVDAAPWNGPMREARFERGEWLHADGTVNKYAFICANMVTSQQLGFCGGSGAINEKGVMLSATVTGRTSDGALKFDQFIAIEEGGYGEPNLPDIMIGNAATAREAVEILGAKISECGHAGPEIYMVADVNEAWYVEVYTGHQWAAVKMPEDQVAVFGNQFNLHAFDTNDTENVMYSPNLIGDAVKNGLARWDDESKGIIDLYETFSPTLWDYANYRTWWGHNAWAPESFPKPYETATSYPLFFDPAPETRISLTDIFELMRTRYEGENCPDENEDTTIRVIGTTKQQSCHVLQMRHELPEDYRCTLWECLSQAEHSTFLPICMAVKSIPEAYSRDQTGNLEYDANRAADAFLRLNTLAETKRFIVDTQGMRQDVRPYYGAGVRDYWREQENRLVAEWPRMQENWLLAGEIEGRAQATAYVNFQQVWSLAEAKRLHDELAWYWAEFNCDLRDGKDALEVPTYPFASSMPTNAELGVTWTQWHRKEFDAYVEKLADLPNRRPSSVVALVDNAKHALDEVEDAESLDLAKTQLQGIVSSLYEEITKPMDEPIIISFTPEFTQGTTSEVPNVSWAIHGPFDRALVTIDGEAVYDGDTRYGEGRWRKLSQLGTHRLLLSVRHGDVEVVKSCSYTAVFDEEEDHVLPQIRYFYPDFYTIEEEQAPFVHWAADNITSIEIYIDTNLVLRTQDGYGEFRFSRLRLIGTHIVRIMAYNVTGEEESSFACRTVEAKNKDSSALLLQAATRLAPVIMEFEPDSYDASILETPYIHWNLNCAVDSLQLTIDNIPVFMGDGRIGRGCWQDLSVLNIDELNGSHEVMLSVSNAFGSATSNFTYTCYWAPPPLPPWGCKENPWQIGDSVQAYTNGVGVLTLIGEGATSNFTSIVSLPWEDVIGSIAKVEVSNSITQIGANLWAGLGDEVVINLEAIAARKMIAAGFPVESPVGEISGAEFERVEIAASKVHLGVLVSTNDNVTATTEGWKKVAIEHAQVEDNGTVTLTIPAPADKGFMILRSKEK